MAAHPAHLLSMYCSKLDALATEYNHLLVTQVQLFLCSVCVCASTCLAGISADAVVAAQSSSRARPTTATKPPRCLLLNFAAREPAAVL